MPFGRMLTRQQCRCRSYRRGRRGCISTRPKAMLPLAKASLRPAACKRLPGAVALALSRKVSSRDLGRIPPEDDRERVHGSAESEAGENETRPIGVGIHLARFRGNLDCCHEPYLFRAAHQCLRRALRSLERMALSKGRSKDVGSMDGISPMDTRCEDRRREGVGTTSRTGRNCKVTGSGGGGI